MVQEDACADLLVAARLSARPVAAIGHLLDADSFDQGYRVQALVDQRHLAAGRQPIGWKVGLTTPEPMLGIVYQDSVLPDHARLDLRCTCTPKIEGEILVRIGHVPDPDCDDATLVASIESVQAALEIADCRIIDWAAPVSHWVADNGCCGWILPASNPVAPDTLDLAAVRMRLTATGSMIAEGEGHNCMGGALNVYRWFLATAARQGRVVRNGDIVMTGSIGRPMLMAADTHYRLEIMGHGVNLGAVSLTTEPVA